MKHLFMSAWRFITSWFREPLPATVFRKARPQKVGEHLYKEFLTVTSVVFEYGRGDTYLQCHILCKTKDGQDQTVLVLDPDWDWSRLAGFANILRIHGGQDSSKYPAPVINVCVKQWESTYVEPDVKDHDIPVVEVPYDEAEFETLIADAGDDDVIRVHAFHKTIINPTFTAKDI